MNHIEARAELLSSRPRFTLRTLALEAVVLLAIAMVMHWLIA